MRNRLVPATFATAAMLLAGGAYAQDDGSRDLDDQRPGDERQEVAVRSDGDETSESQMTVDEALQALEEMKQDEGFSALLEQARGVFIIPDYAKVAAVVGGEGGEGVALLKQDGQDAEWSAPAFYNIGGASIGAEAGAQVGQIAMLIMNDETAEMFKDEEDNWSFNADAGVTFIDYSTAVQGSAGQGDVVVWTDTEGAFAGASVGVSDISQDEEENEAYYGQDVDARQILSGDVSTDRARELREALSR